ncbi:MAG: hypothetical protein E7634_00085 [Ruminococcaceae bacterium]|nr:hypothetical protein [Oscillospiraceae bacterium]
MQASFYYISRGKLFSFSDGKTEEIHSGVLNTYISKVRDSAQRNEWKYTGTGAEFIGTKREGASPEDSVSAVRSAIHCFGEHAGDIIYSISIDETNGIYRKRTDGDSAEGIVLCTGNGAYSDFDIRGNLMAASAAFAGESHIGVLDMTTQNFTTYTEGNSRDTSPAWAAFDPNKIYFCCMGLPIKEAKDPNYNAPPRSISQIVSEMYDASTVVRGPSSICLLDTSLGTLDEILSDDRYDFTHPQSLGDGSLYYIRKPYRQNSDKRSSFGCLAEIALLPFRLLEALFGFLNVFSAKYSGKTLSKNDVKHRDEKQMYIDGNLINAEKELRANAKKGDKNPGIIPRSWELRRLDSSGNDTLIKRGVSAFRVNETTGDILLSNGSHILKLDKNGKEEKILSAPKVTFIK